jgi:hypothetical protein
MNGLLNVNLIRENEDGSADFDISGITPEVRDAFVRLGIIKALEDAIKRAEEEYTPPPHEGFEDEGS